jgi:6-phosphogluconolactonase
VTSFHSDCASPEFRSSIRLLLSHPLRLEAVVKNLRFLRHSVVSIGFALIAHFSYAQIDLVVTSPAAGEQVSSPVNFIAASSAQECSAGINAMRIYPSPGDGAYTVLSDEVNVDLNLTAGPYSATVVAWDNCGHVLPQTVNFTVSGETLPPPKFVYTTEYQAGKVTGYVVNPQSGALTPTGQPPVWAHWGPTSIASDSGGYRLYVANQGSEDVSAYFIDRDNGYLTPVPGANFPVGGWSTDIAVHPSNHFVYVTTMDFPGGPPPNQNTITGLSVASDGALAPVPGSPYPTSPTNPAYLGLAITPDGNYLYAGSNAGNISAYSIDQSTGALTALPGSPYTVPPAQCEYCLSSVYINALAIDRSGKFLFVPDWENGVIFVYSIDQSTGALAQVAGSPFIDDEPQCPQSEYCLGAVPASISVDARNKFVYVLNQADNDIVTFELDASTGALTLDTLSFPASNTYQYAFNGVVRTDPSGSFVFALGTYTPEPGSPGIGQLYGLAVDQGDGGLTQVPSSPYSVSGQMGIDGLAVTQ